MENPPTVKEDGFIPVPQGPGLGVEIDRSLIKK
jgi:L-alanine-DL-glutamate epimerase-like enolase superfamily enzyme